VAGAFRIQPHGRLQEWVADEKGYFHDEGLHYVFVNTRGAVDTAAVQSTESAPVEIKQGAFESMEEGRACDVSSACHWAVNMAASGSHGKMYGHAYSIMPAGIYVPPESPIRAPEDLAGAEIGVGYHTGSHFSALQSLAPFLKPEQTRLKFLGFPLDRLQLLLDRRIAASNVIGVPVYVLEQQGFRKVLDTTFMVGFLITGDSSDEDVAKYFRALRRAQRDIDLEPELYKHHLLKELPEAYHCLVDYRAFGPGERLIFEPYTREMYEKTHRWMLDMQIFPADQAGSAPYEVAVLA
jgi:NitT/TauT family transport system substrate-binding protein